MTDDKIEFWVTGERTVVYLNGKMVQNASSYKADEWLQERCGVVIVQDDAGVCLRSDGRALEALDEVHAADRARAARLEQAAELRADAAKLLEAATALEGKDDVR